MFHFYVLAKYKVLFSMKNHFDKSSHKSRTQTQTFWEKCVWIMQWNIFQHQVTACLLMMNSKKMQNKVVVAYLKYRM
jgi:hypothetical protein